MSVLPVPLKEWNLDLSYMPSEIIHFKYSWRSERLAGYAFFCEASSYKHLFCTLVKLSRERLTVVEGKE